MKKLTIFHKILCYFSPIISVILIFFTYGLTSGVGDSTDSSYYVDGRLDSIQRSIDYANANKVLDIIVVIFLTYILLSFIYINYKSRKISPRFLFTTIFGFVVYVLLLIFNITV